MSARCISNFERLMVNGIDTTLIIHSERLTIVFRINIASAALVGVAPLNSLR